MKRMKDKSWLSKKSFPSDQSSSVAAEAAESRSSALISTNILCERKFSMKSVCQLGIRMVTSTIFLLMPTTDLNSQRTP